MRPAFGKHLEKICKNEAHRIVMGKGITETIEKFKKDNSSSNKFLLIDFADLKALNDDLVQQLKNDKNVFFMTQTMESWFLSQPKILDNHFHLQNVFEKKFKNKNCKAFTNPFQEIKITLKSHTKKQFKKLRDGAKVLEKLNTLKLKKYFLETNKIDLSQICQTS